jgi:hypothetical protein
MEHGIKNISVSKTTMYGRFEIIGNVNGEWISFITTNSTIYDNRSGDNCDTEEEMLAHEEAMEYCAALLLEKYNTIKNRI